MHVYLNISVISTDMSYTRMPIKSINERSAKCCAKLLLMLWSSKSKSKATKV